MWTFGEVTGKKVVSHSVHLGTVLHKDKEFATDFMYDMKKLLLICYNQLAYASWFWLQWWQMSIWLDQFLTDWETSLVTNRPLIIWKGILLEHLFCVVGIFSMATLCISSSSSSSSSSSNKSSSNRISNLCWLSNVHVYVLLTFSVS